MGDFSAKAKKVSSPAEQKALTQTSLASKAVAKSVHHTPLKQDVPPETFEVPDINLDKALHALLKDIDFNIQPGVIGSVIPAAEMWGRNKKIVRVQEYTQRALAVITDLKALAETQHDLRAKRLVDYEAMTLKLSLARAQQEIHVLQNGNNAMIQDLAERITRMEREGVELKQRLDIERESHELSMEEHRLQIRIKELQAKLLEKQLEE